MAGYVWRGIRPFDLTATDQATRSEWARYQRANARANAQYRETMAREAIEMVTANQRAAHRRAVNAAYKRRQRANLNVSNPTGTLRATA